MHIQAYLRILSDEQTIRTIHKETKVPGASIKQLKSRRNSTRDEFWWNWETSRCPISPDDQDKDLKAMLNLYEPIFPLIRKYSGPMTDIYLEIITRYGEKEDPLGLYLSAETISLLGKLGASLDCDVYGYSQDSG
jgi:uncharacterized protein DUF4279